MQTSELVRLTVKELQDLAKKLGVKEICWCKKTRFNKANFRGRG